LRRLGLDALDFGAQLAVFLLERVETLEDRLAGIVGTRGEVSYVSSV
jgi:hypothetical protein